MVSTGSLKVPDDTTVIPVAVEPDRSRLPQLLFIITQFQFEQSHFTSHFLWNDLAERRGIISKHYYVSHSQQ